MSSALGEWNSISTLGQLQLTTIAKSCNNKGCMPYASCDDMYKEAYHGAVVAPCDGSGGHECVYFVPKKSMCVLKVDALANTATNICFGDRIGTRRPFFSGAVVTWCRGGGQCIYFVPNSAVGLLRECCCVMHRRA